MDLTSEDMDALKGKPGVVLVIEPEFRTFSIKMNTAFGPMADVNMRRAISHAFDYQAMLDLAGYAQLMVGPLPHGIFGHDPNLKVPRTDLAKAKELLAKTTTPNGGIKLTFTHVTGLEQQRRWALVLLDGLKKLNIDLDIKPMVWPDMVALTKSPQTAPDFFPVYQTANYGDTDNIAFAAYHSTNNGNWQNMVYKSAKVDGLIERGRAETDLAKRAAIYKELQETIVEDAPDIFGVLEKRKLAMRTDVENFKFIPVASNAPELFGLSHQGLIARCGVWPMVRHRPLTGEPASQCSVSSSVASSCWSRCSSGCRCWCSSSVAYCRAIRCNWRPGRTRRKDEIAALAREFGLDQPLAVQYLTYAKGLMVGDWGRSIQSRQPVLDDLKAFLPATLELVIAAMFVAIAIGIPLGLISAVYRDRWPDVLSRALSLGSVSIPRFFLGLLLQLGFAMWLGWLPLGGRIPIILSPPPFWTGFYSIDTLIAGDLDAFRSGAPAHADAGRRAVTVAAGNHHPHDAGVDA